MHWSRHSAVATAWLIARAGIDMAIISLLTLRSRHLRIPIILLTSRVDQPLLAFTLTDPDVRISRIRLFQAGNPDRPGANCRGALSLAWAE